MTIDPDPDNMPQDLSDPDPANMPQDLSDPDPANMPQDLSDPDPANMPQDLSDPDPANMPEFLSDEWVAWLDSRLSQSRVDAAADLVLEYRVTDDDGAVRCWHVRIASGRVSAAAADPHHPPGEPVVVLSSDRDTARAIAIDGKSAQRAFAEGRLRLSGDPRLLLAARPALEALGTALAGPA